MGRVPLAMAISILLVSGCSTPGSGPRPQAAVSTPVPALPPTPQPTAQVTPPAQASSDSKPVRLQKTTIKTKQGQRWEMEADEVDWMNENSQAKAQEVTWFLLDPQGQRTVKVESPGADVDMNSEVVTFTGEVVAQRMDSEESLVVQHLVYNGKEREFHGSEGVVWKRKGFELAGQTLTATAELDKVQLKGRVKGKTAGDLPTAENSNGSDQRDR